MRDTASASEDRPPLISIEDVPVGLRQRRLALAVVTLLLLAGVAATPLANLPLRPVPGYMAIFGTAMVVVNLLLAALLYLKGRVERRGDAIRLGSAYFFVCAVFVPMTAAFPGALVEGPLIGTTVTPVWLWTFWHAGFGLAILRYGWAAARRDGKPAALGREIAVTLAAVAGMTLAATLLLPWLPGAFGNGRTFFTGTALLIPALVLGLNLVALAAVARLRGGTPEELWVAVGMVASCLDVWLTIVGGDRYAVGWYFAKFTSFLTSLVVIVSNMHSLTVLYNRIAAANRTLRVQANEDGLTGLCNRSCFDTVCEREWKRARREGLPLGLLMVDVDHFKRYNDRYGHQAGDACLRQVARALGSLTQRPGDVAARYGGEEFVLLLPNTDAEGARAVAEMVLARVRELGLPHDGSEYGIVTVSIGAASALAGGSGSQELLLADADIALYKAKDGGRNAVVLAPPRPRLV